MSDLDSPLAPGHIDRALVWAAVIVFGLLVAAITVLGLADKPVDPLFRTGSIIVSVIGAAGALISRQRISEKILAPKLDAITAQTNLITHQTNGVLSEKIHQGATRAILGVFEDYGITPAPGAPAAPPATDPPTPGRMKVNGD